MEPHRGILVEIEAPWRPRQWIHRLNQCVGLIRYTPGRSVPTTSIKACTYRGLDFIERRDFLLLEHFQLLFRTPSDENLELLEIGSNQ